MAKKHSSPGTPEERIAQLEAEAAEKDTIIREQAKELRVSQRNRGENARPIAEVNGAHYLVMGGVLRPGTTEKLSAEELARDKDLCKQLIEINSGLLVPAN